MRQQFIEMNPFIAGMLVAFPMTLGVGPSLVLYFQATIQRGFGAGLAVLSGIWVSDIGFIFVNYLGISHIFTTVSNQRIAAVASAGVLVVLGCVQLVRKPVPIPCSKGSSVPGAQSIALSRAKSKVTRDFLSGFIVNSSNPALLAYWMTLIGLTGANFGFRTHSSYSFLAGIFLGELFCDTVKCLAFTRINLRLNPLLHSWVNRIAGSALIVAAAGIVLKSFVFQH
jgi:L-lysine exporter family protein LysE/ArgO